MFRAAFIPLFCAAVVFAAALPAHCAPGAPAKKPRPVVRKAVPAKPLKPLAKLPAKGKLVKIPLSIKIVPAAVSASTARAAITRPVFAYVPLKPSPSLLLGTGAESAMVDIVGGGKGRINYEANVVKAVGLGALPPPTLSRSRAQDALDARHAALADALRTLGMAVSQVRVSSNSRVQNYVLQSDEIRVRVRALVQSAQVVEEKYLPASGVFRVVLQTNLTGPNSLSEAVGVGNGPQQKRIVDENEKGSGGKNNTLVSDRTPSSPPADPFAPGAPAPQSARYTSVIVDCRGLEVRACMSPRLFRKSGDEVYGTMHVSPDYVIETGIAAFPRSMKDALRSQRTGERPLIVRATRVKDDNRFYPVISDRDAQALCDADRESHFFERTAVVFLLDPAQ